MQDVRVFSEDGTCKVVEIPVDMTARDLCQLLVHRSHCVDDNSWALVEHHLHLGLGRERPRQAETAVAKVPAMLLRWPCLHSRAPAAFPTRPPLLLKHTPSPHSSPSTLGS